MSVYFSPSRHDGSVEFEWTDGAQARVERGLSADAVSRLANQRFSLSSGYFEVGLPGGFPAVTVGFEGEVAVLHGFHAADAVFLLLGDGSVPDDQEVQVPILDSAVRFAGRFAMTTEVARDAVEVFAHHGRIESLGAWDAL